MPLSLHVAWYVCRCHCTLHGMYAAVIARCMVCMPLSLYVAWYVCRCHCTLHGMYAVVIVRCMLCMPLSLYCIAHTGSTRAKQRGRGDAHGRTSQGAVDCWQQRIAVLLKWEWPLTGEAKPVRHRAHRDGAEARTLRDRVETVPCTLRPASHNHRQLCEALAKPTVAPTKIGTEAAQAAGSKLLQRARG